MKDYVKEAIKNGEAIDSYKNPKKVREIIENNIGFMRDGFSDIDKQIENYVNFYKGKGYVFIQDLEITMTLFILKNSNQYIKNCFQKIKEEMTILPTQSEDK